MTIKEFAYSAQQHLHISTGFSFKRAHIYELLAASFGFNSYAALSAKVVFTVRRQVAKYSSKHNSAIRQRCVELGYLPATADVASSELPAFVAERQIDVVRLPDLVAGLRGESSLLEGDEGDQLDDDREEMLVRTWSDTHDEEFSPMLMDGLETAASKGIELAHYALALIHAPDEYDHNKEVGSSYWYSQAQQGRVLTGVNKEWADAYAQQLAEAEKYARHLKEAARLGNKHALLDLAERFGDPSFFEKTHGSIADDPVKVAKIAERLGRKEDVRRWLAIAAEAGDTDSMRRLIEEFDQEDIQLCWTWVYFARLVDTDLTQDECYAIHEDGSPYDDDVGGPAYVDSRDGVKLAPLSAEQDATARLAALDLFEKIQRTGEVRQLP
ncbi:conserved hypothetical protein [Candidatus Nitrotoga sp. HW29]|uniref:hypothetical protein n=1 Tax=Candidatus Nitrotoga sp. HW29 TaxID=2886963 RepID=UPI001EF275B4|nr:hypothetical protein [Candidatus Nitrotoga sp. HW29]CAH1905017.1 conserved hypothetical protein [Candidatus Nitrotoga sp. HW29]